MILIRFERFNMLQLSCADADPFYTSSNLWALQIFVKHIKIVLNSLQLIRMRLVERQWHGMMKSLGPWGSLPSSKDLCKICAISNRNEFALIPSSRSPFHCMAPNPSLNRPVVRLVPQIRAKSSLPVATYLILEVPALHLKNTNPSIKQSIISRN